MASPDTKASLPPARRRDRSVTGGQPVLVTGVPRSGTTWLSRMLAHAPGTALPGREPMNPRGKQFALAGTVSSWARLIEPTPAQARALRRCYAGLDPRVYSKFGVRQWAAAWPLTRVVIKDPFAVLSIRGIVGVTGALPVLVYRDPAAVLASYQRMGWFADTAEMQALGMPVRSGLAGDDQNGDQVMAMADFWMFIHETALADLAELGEGVVVSHDELVRGGAPAMERLFDACGLPWTAEVAEAVGGSGGTAEPGSAHSESAHSGSAHSGSAHSGSAESGSAGARPALRGQVVVGAPTDRTLHVFDRSRAAVADGWRKRLDPHDIDTMHRATVHVWQALEAVKLSVLGDESR